MENTELNYRLERLMRAASENEAAFHAAASAVHGDEPRLALLNRAAHYATVAATLRGLMPDREGATWRTRGPAPGNGHVRDDFEILADCERREDLVAVAFRDALESRPPEAVRETLEREFAALLARMGGLRTLRERIARRSTWASSM